MPRRPLNGLRVLVTGASSGIGRELALQLASSGSHVLAVARRQERLDELVAEFESDDSPKAIKTANVPRGKISTLLGDVTLAIDRQRWIDWCDEHWSGLDVLINNAGSGAIGRFDEATSDRLSRLMEVDFFGPVELTRLCLPLLHQGKTTKPAIVIIGSVLAHRGVPLKSEYCAAKFALRGWAESLRCELAKIGIDVLEIDPSTTSSEFFESLIDTQRATKSRSLGSMTPKQVAMIAIRSIENSKTRTIVSWGGWALVWCSRLFPSLADRILVLKVED